MPTRHILSPSNSRELLATIPALLGFTARESLVLVAFGQGPRGKPRSREGLRVDLPDEHADHVAEYAADVASLVTRLDGATAVVAVIYTDAPLGAGAPVPGIRIWRALQAAFVDVGLDVLDGCCVAANGWTSYLDDEGRHPHPLEELITDPIHFEAKLHHDREIDDVSRFAPLPAPGDALRGEVTRRTRALLAALPDRFPDRTLKRALGRSVRQLSSVIAGARPEGAPAQTLARVAALMQIPIARELAIILAFFASKVATITFEVVDGSGVHYCIRGRTDADRLDARVTRPILEGTLGERPDHQRLSNGTELLRHVAAALPDDLRGGPQAALAWTLWAKGLSTPAAEHLRQVREIDPRNELAALFDEPCIAGALPAWCFAPRLRD